MPIGQNAPPVCICRGMRCTRFGGVTYLMGRLLAYEPAADPAALRADLADRSLHQATIVYTYNEGQLHPYCRLGPLAGNHDSSYPAAVQDEEGC